MDGCSDLSFPLPSPLGPDPISIESSKLFLFSHSFSWALLQANSCVRQLRGFLLSRFRPYTDVGGLFLFFCLSSVRGFDAEGALGRQVSEHRRDGSTTIHADTPSSTTRAA
jgi:hypothetical protein